MQQEIRWCLSHWREARLLHLEALTRWLGRYDSENQRAFLLYLFHEKALKRLEEEQHPADFIRKYLENIASVHTINPESTRRILRLAREPQVILSTLHLLFKAEKEEARLVFWEALEQGRFSEADAAQILAHYPEFAGQLLKAASASPLRKRLLLALSRHLDLPEWVIKIGYYVLFDAGWGEILEVRGASCSDCFLREEEQPTLVVELLHWPGQKAEINLARGEMTLLGLGCAIRCGCQRFVALEGKDFQDIWNTHRARCKTNSKSTILMPASLSGPPRYQANRPPDIFDTLL